MSRPFWKKKETIFSSNIKVFKNHASICKLGAFGHASFIFKKGDHHHHLFIKTKISRLKKKKKKSSIHFQTRGIQLCLISANSIRANQDKFKLVLQDLIRWILNLSHLNFPHDQKFPMTKKIFHAQKIPITKITCPKNSHAQNYMSKKNSHDQNHVSKKFP